MTNKRSKKEVRMMSPTLHAYSLIFLVLISLTHLPLSSPSPSSSSWSSSLRKLSQDLTSIHFIGDLHADVSCAKQWVEKTNLVNLTSTPYEWIGNPTTDALVFLGDYVDKGSNSASVLKFVRELQETFPNNVVTMLGNHDFFLILDTALSFSETNPHPLGHPFYDYAYSFMHPEEYIESEWTMDREGDEELLGEILLALSYIYDRNMQGSVHLCAPNCTTGQQDLFDIVPPFDQNVTLKERAVERLNLWRLEYARGLYESGLLQWMTKQPIVAIVGDALVVHGGVSDRVMDYVQAVARQQQPQQQQQQEQGMNVVDVLHAMTNVVFHRFFQKELEKVSGANQIEARLTGGYVLELIMDMLQHRGYFDRITGCSEVNQVLGKLDSSAGLNRVVVGHTPHDYATELCNGKLLASDSSLSRSFRAHGNMYCPLRKSLVEGFHNKSGGGGDGRMSTCSKVHDEQCEGSISRITRASPKEAWPKGMQRFQFHELQSMASSTTTSDGGSMDTAKDENIMVDDTDEL
mmetsp:Transcript_13884/g.26148  ORF Transcript_13884/g.26148 Transcript_13884/m.26148 type:complete len:520 (-) Transcript_13884:2241-3800(-)